MTATHSITIDPEFKALIPPLSADEFDGLAKSIQAEGCRDALVVWKETGVLIDGHNRHELCESLGIPFNTIERSFADREAVKEWIICNQFARRNLTTFARGELALKLEPLIAARAKKNQQIGGGSGPSGRQKSDNPTDTKKELARIAGVSHDTISKVKLVVECADEETKSLLRNSKDKSLNAVAKSIKETNQREARKAKRVEAASLVEITDKRVIVGDFRDHAHKVADGSVNLIFTDPPYDREASKMLPELGEFAASKLCDGGSLICYVGHTQLPDAIDAFRGHLRYWWTICCLHSGGTHVMREYGLRPGWKAVLWFVKVTRDDNSVIVSDVMSGGREKDSHDWQQSESEAAYWIEKLCPEDGLVCDPFIGGGTTAAVSRRLNRKWVGFEIDEEQARIASARIHS